jgi:hypothetical protein
VLVADAWREIGIQGLGGLLAGLALLAITYEVLERKLQIQERFVRWQDEKAKADAARRAVLKAVLLELEGNAEALAVALRALAARRVSFPLFSTGVLRVAFDADFFPVMSSQTVERLVEVYDRFDSANSLHAMVFDLWRGPTSVMSGLLTATALDIPKVQEAYSAFVDDRLKMMDALRRRCEEIQPRLYGAIEAVEGDLGITGRPSPAERPYERTHAEYVGGGRPGVQGSQSTQERS